MPAHAPPRTGSARKLGEVLLQLLNDRRAAQHAPADAAAGATVTAGEAGLV
jgi:hypothetical protein